MNILSLLDQDNGLYTWSDKSFYTYMETFNEYVLLSDLNNWHKKIKEW